MSPMARNAIFYAYAGFLALVGALVFAGVMKVHGDTIHDKWVIKGTAEAIDKSRTDMVVGLFGNADGTPMMFKDEAGCKAFSHTPAFADRTAKMAIIMSKWHPPARLKQECVTLGSLHERDAGIPAVNTAYYASGHPGIPTIR